MRSIVWEEKKYMFDVWVCMRYGQNCNAYDVYIRMFQLFFFGFLLTNEIFLRNEIKLNLNFSILVHANKFRIKKVVICYFLMR